jgi:hypothetical protein
MSLLSMGVVVIVAFIVVPFIRSRNMHDTIIKIETAYIELYGNKSDFTDDEWEVRLTAFSIAVHNFERAYPNEKDNAERFLRYLRVILGVDPDDPDQQYGPSEQDRFNQLLIDTAKAAVIDVTELTVANAALNVRVSNPSEVIIMQVTMEIEGFDSEGGSLGKAVIRTPRDEPIMPGAAERYFFRNLWGGAVAAEAKLVWLNVNYGQGREDIFFQQAVCEVLWP